MIERKEIDELTKYWYFTFVITLFERDSNMTLMTVHATHKSTLHLDKYPLMTNN